MADHAPMSAAWNGDGASQEEFMAKDECIVLDHDDNIVGHQNKRSCHVFSPEQPRGVLHRAFSVFLFNEDGDLLLQKRASSKITFPGVWTNTCCSHPLFMDKEIDRPAQVQDGSTPGAKHAAVRKLEHELGILPREVPMASFKFLTRLHYWAADALTHGSESPWGEHEIDYILFVQTSALPPLDQLRARFNPDEVEDVAFVSLPQLQAMMAQEGLLWSPWFRIIAERFLPKWWEDLSSTLSTDAHFDPHTIHRFDPPTAHMGGGGHAGPFLSPPQSSAPLTKKSEAAAKKQGAYGKVRTHKEGLMGQLVRLDEVYAALRMKLLPPLQAELDLRRSKNEDERFCGDMLCKVSRSFAAVILQLPEELCRAIAVFYLVLRALDTIEDDMQAFSRPDTKIRHLKLFHHVALGDDKWSMYGVGEGDEALLVERFGHVVRVFRSLAPGVQAVIKDITQKMGEGMAEFVGKDLGHGTQNLAEWDRYCHFVAGLVGIGLSRIFYEGGAESQAVANDTRLSNSMGLFLQKTNIIRDYLEDFVDGRAFWPQDVWLQYSGGVRDLGVFARNPNAPSSLWCLNHLVTNALDHVDDCIGYLASINDPKVFRFCAIPQVMAVATLEKLYNNPLVFTGVVKIRKGLACRLITSSNTLDEVKAVFAECASEILARVPDDDPNAACTRAKCRRILELTRGSASRGPCASLVPVVAVLAALVVAGTAAHQ